VNESQRDTKPHILINSNAITKHQCPSIPIKDRRHRITVLRTESLLDIPSNNYTTKKTVRFLRILRFKKRNLRPYLKMKLKDRFYRCRYMRKILLPYSVEGQVSRSDER